MKLKPSVKKAMEKLHIDKLRPNQIKPINAIMDGNDTVVIAPTSFGKSLIYQIPAIAQKDALTIVLEPLLALIHDQVHKLKKLKISAAYPDSTQSQHERKPDPLYCSGTTKFGYIVTDRTIQRYWHNCH